MSNVTVIGLQELGAKIDKLFKDTAKRAVRKASAAGGEVYRKGMIRRAPERKEGGPKGKDKRLPGFGKKHIKRASRANSDGSLSTFVGPDKNAFYLVFDEKGTSHQAAHPFMRPTFDQDSEAAEKAFAAVLTKEIEKEL